MSGSKRKIYSAPALEKGLDILEFLAASPESVSLSSLANRLHRSVGEIFRMLAVLEQRQYVAATPGSDKYQLTMKMLQLAHMHLPINMLVNAASSPMRGLAQRTGQSCHLAVLDDTFIRVIARQESFADLSFSVRVGTHAPVFQSCSGNVLYAFADAAARGQILDRVARASDTALDMAAINRRAASIREQGWYAAKSAKTVGITDIGYPVFDHRGTVSAVLAIPYLDRLDIDSKADQELVRSELSKAAAEISDALSARAPD